MLFYKDEMATTMSGDGVVDRNENGNENESENNKNKNNTNWKSQAREWIDLIMYELKPFTFPSAQDLSSLHSTLEKSSEQLSSAIRDIAMAFIDWFKSQKTHDWTTTFLRALPWVLILLVGASLGFGAAVAIALMIRLVFVNLGEKAKGDEWSAYSVFNRGFRRLMGSIDARALERQYVGGALAGVAPDEGNDGENEGFVVVDYPGDEVDADVGSGQVRSRRSGKKARRDYERRRSGRRQADEDDDDFSD